MSGKPRSQVKVRGKLLKFEGVEYFFNVVVLNDDTFQWYGLRYIHVLFLVV
jgi:hypothetical protein